jgi:hypothetical protein
MQNSNVILSGQKFLACCYHNFSVSAAVSHGIRSMLHIFMLHQSHYFLAALRGTWVGIA